MPIDRKFVIERQGKEYVTYPGLLDLAHQMGLVSIQMEAVTVTANFAQFKATVTMVTKEGGARVFEEYGDSTPENVGRMVAPHYVRLASTRAKARALRDACNIGATALEELGDLDDDHHAPAPAQRRQAATPTPIRAPKPDPAGADAATPAQVRAIYLIGRDQHGMSDADIDARSVSLYEKPPADLTKAQAGHLITVLKVAPQGQQGEAPPDGDFENLGHAAPQHVAPGAAEAPSPAQKKFLWDLAKGQRMDKAALDAAAHRMFNLAGVENLDRRQIARLIDHLKNTGATDEREDIPQ